MRHFATPVFSSLLPLLLLSAVPGKSLAFTPKMLPDASAAACTLDGGVYHCNLPAFQRALTAAHNLSIETQPMDHMAAAQLRRLVGTLGKQLATTDHPGDLTIALTPVQMSGVNYGPGDHDLATLRVYTVDGGNRRGDLLWAETLRGQGDRPWPAQVHDLIAQFQTRLNSR